MIIQLMSHGLETSANFARIFLQSYVDKQNDAPINCRNVLGNLGRFIACVTPVLGISLML